MATLIVCGVVSAIVIMSTVIVCGVVSAIVIMDHPDRLWSGVSYSDHGSP